MSPELVRLWRFLDEHRRTTPTNKSVVEALASEQDIEVTTDLLQEVSKAFGSRFSAEYLSSPDVSAFIADIAATRSPSTVLDPTCGSGLLLKLVADRVNASVVHGVEIDESIGRVAKRLLGDGGSVFVGDILQTNLPLEASYDLVVAEPPFGMRMQDPVNIEGLDYPICGDFTDLLATWASSKLSEDGRAILILPPSFLWSRRSEQAKKAITDLRCAVTGCIQLPGGSLQGTGIEAYVVVIERSDQKKLFVGQYTTDTKHQKVLIENLVSRKEGRRPAQGRLCDWSDFRGYLPIEAQDRIQRLVARLGFEPVLMSELVVEATRTNRAAFQRLGAKPNSVYLPLVGRAGGTDSQEHLPERLKDYVQLQLDPNLAHARFVVELLTRELGQAILDTSRIGGGIPRVRLADLLQATFYLPPLAVQEKVLSSLDRIASIRAEVDELEAALWTDTRNIDQLARQVEVVNHEDRFEDWIETLPFPLATILWRYRAASGTTREKYEALLHFFEALAEFLATVHLSAFSSDAEIWSQHREDLHRALDQRGLSLERGTFGAWKCVAEYLGARLRETAAKSPEVCAALYRTHNPQTVSMLASSKLIEVLQRANSMRNNWVGHVGAVSEKQAAKIHDELFSLVQQCRGVFGRSWLDYELIQPGESRFREGLFRYKVRRLQGTRSAPFETVSRESIEGMEDGALYLFGPSGDRGLRLLPFVRVMPSPRTEENACYFFNRIEGNDKCRYVSYHCAQDAELTNAFQDTRDALRSLADVRGGDA
jgi:SAM-dependent methyltransferase